MATKSFTVELRDVQYTVVPSRGTKYLWVKEGNKVKVPELLWREMNHGNETALVDALLLSMEMEMRIFSLKNIKERADELEEAEAVHAEQVKFLSNRWYDFRHEARKRGEPVPKLKD